MRIHLHNSMIFASFKSLILTDSLRISKDVCSCLRNNLLENSRTGSAISRRFFSYNLLGKKLVSSPVRSSNVLKRFSSEVAGSKKEKPKTPLTWKNLLISAGIGVPFVGYLMYLKAEKQKLKEMERKRALGKARIGGKFDLVDESNNKVTSDDLLGNWLLVYFGFTHCPDICPDEIEKMVNVVETIEKAPNMENVKPVFITVDPQRDTPSVVGKYVKEFSDKLLGLTGTTEQIAAACKAYRVYFSAGPKDSDSDYIVDHTIIMYLIDPDGNFVDYYGQNKNVDQIVSSIHVNMVKYNLVHSKDWMTKIANSIFS